MDSPVTPLVASSVLPAALPGWTLSRGREPDELAAAFAAGITGSFAGGGGILRSHGRHDTEVVNLSDF